MRFNRVHEAAPPPPPPPKRRLKTKPLVVLIGILFLTNVLWFFNWLFSDSDAAPVAEVEEVASVAGKPIMRSEWMAAMEQQVGRDVLEEMVNHRVMEAAAEEYGIKVTEQEVDLELALISSVDGQIHSGLNHEQTRQKIRANLILDKVLTKDVVISEDVIRKYYDEHESLFNILTAYRTFIIVSPTKQEAEQALKELKDGSNFDVLAKERSIDLASGSLGGDIGYINEQTEQVDPAIIDAASHLKEGKTSGVIKLKDNTYAIVQVREVIEGRHFKFKEVKDHIRRERALEQLSQSVSPEAFWEEFDAKWFYGKE